MCLDQHKNMYKICIIYLCVFTLLKHASACEIPLEVSGVKDYCWAQKVEVVERLQQAEKKVVNFAKKKLGIDINEPNEPQKCDYYYCIFKEMKLINPEYDVPCVDRTTKWIQKNVIYNQALILLDRVQNCTGELASSMKSENYFLTDNVDATPEDHIVEDSHSEPQSKCEIAGEYMKCLAMAEKDVECPIFQYP